MYYSATTGLTDPTNLWYAIQTYCETTEPSFVNNIPIFIRSAEQRIYNAVQLPATRKTVTLATPYNNNQMTLPTDWLSIFSIAVKDSGTLNSTNKYTYLLNKDVNFILESFPDPTYTDMPMYYAISDSTSIILGPTPSRAFPVQLNYYAYPTSIVTAGTSWLGTNFETVLLYGSIREAYTYLKGEADLAATYEQKYQESLGLLKVLGDGKDRQDVYRSGQARVPVT